MKLEQPTKNIDVEVAKRKEKGAKAFSKSYETAFQLRNFERGWGQYEDKKGVTFAVLISSIGDRSRNLAKDSITKGEKLNPKFVDEIQKQIKEAREKLIRFEEKEKLSSVLVIRFQLDELSEVLREGDAMRIFESAIELRSYYSGFMQANEILLAKADEASGDYNSATKK